MQESSFANSGEPAAEAADVTPDPRPRPAKAGMLFLNALPFCHVTAMVIGSVFAHRALVKAAIVFGGIYLVPPLLFRGFVRLRPLRAGSFRLSAPEFLCWWASAQAQILFCRFPFLEELLRLVPGLYSAWLRLWGAKIGRLTYWAPEVHILDRPLLEIGDNVIFGAGVRLNPHVIADDESGSALLHLGPVLIGNDCRVGGYSVLAAGTTVEAGQTLNAFSLSPPFTIWRNGRRAKIAIPQ